MKQSIRLVALSLVALAIPAMALLIVGDTVSAVDPADEITRGIQGAGGRSDERQLETSVTDIVNILLFLIGAIAVVMIVVGGIRYTLSNGDSSQITAAKNTILYAVVGLVVAILAYAIVRFVVDNL